MTRLLGDGSYVGWQDWVGVDALPIPAVWAYGPAWTTLQVDTVAAYPGWANVPLLSLYTHTSQNPANCPMVDVEISGISAYSDVLNWLQIQLAKPGGYQTNRPTIYLNINGSYWQGASSDILTPLWNAGYYVSQSYDIWVANLTGTVPGSPTNINLGPGHSVVACVATQYNGYNPDPWNESVIFDNTWYGTTPPISVQPIGTGTGARLLR
jgi:hypothetical protein